MNDEKLFFSLGIVNCITSNIIYLRDDAMASNNIHTTALVETSDIEESTVVGAFVHILPKAIIGKGCVICDQVYIGDDVIIGDNVTIDVGAYLTGNLVIEDNVRVGPNVGFHRNIKLPYDQDKAEQTTKVLQGASIGANVTIPHGTVIGINSVITDGAVINTDVPPNAIVSGNPAQIIGYKDSRTPSANIPEVDVESLPLVGITAIGVGEAAVHKMPKITDLRGSLTFAEIEQYLPFVVKRYFIVYDVLSDKARGEHSHKNLHQYLVCVKGRCSVVVDDGDNMKEVKLESPQIGLHITPGVWGIQYKFSNDAVLVVFASDKYDDKDYVRNYDEFLTMVNK